MSARGEMMMKTFGCAAAVAVLTLVLQATAVASSSRVQITSSTRVVERGSTNFVIARTPRDVPCSISLFTRSHRVARSAAKRRGSSRALEFSWRFPVNAPGGSWVATVGCGGGVRPASVKIETPAATAAARPAARLTIRVSRILAAALPRVNERPTKGAKGGGAYPPYGTVILPGREWFGGHGVDVKSNGYSGNPNGNWQCVELFERFINAQGWFHGIAGAGSRGAVNLFANVPSSAFDKHPNGTGYVPVPGDAVIFSDGNYGHVAIVNSVAGGQVNLVEQNASASGRTSISISGGTLGKDGRETPVGVLHAKANTSPPASAPSPAQPQSAGGPVFGVQNTSETSPDGVYFRNSPHTADTSSIPGLGVYSGEQVSLACYGYGDSVGAYNDALWYRVTNVTRPTTNGIANVGWLNAHYVNDGKAANEVDAGVPVCAGYPATPGGPAAPETPSPSPSPAPPGPAPTFAETTGGVAHTWTNYTNAGGTEGPSIPSNATVQIACKLGGFAVADGNTWWYRIASSPWNGAYYVSADAFYNNGQTSGSLHGTPFVDPAVPNC
jgi:hypothetical protein